MTEELKLPGKVHYTLRVAAAMCFIGHGSFGIMGKAIWCNYFGVFGIDQHLAYQLMPFVGGMDVLLGIILLIYPLRAIPFWLVIWGFITALLRPLSGEPFPEFLERAGNFGAPLSLLLLGGFPKNFRQLFSRLNPKLRVNESTLALVANCLRIVAFFLLMGHGWLNLIEKKALVDQYNSLGFPNPETMAQIVGMAEIVSAFIILVKPFRQFVFVIFLWKMTSELFYPAHEIFEWIERGGSYGTLLALWLIMERSFSTNRAVFFNLFRSASA
jgi:hypothetical protein